MGCKIAIIGSCVTRDALEFIEDAEVCLYLSRVSLLSMYSPIPTVLPEIQPDLKGFLRTKLIEDFHKQHMTKLKSTSFDYLIIDFIDERFSVRSDANGALITNSHYVRSHTNADDSFSKIDYRLTHGSLGKWVSAANKFSNDLLSNVAQEKIVIHEAYWAGESKEVDRNNTFLAIYYNFLKVLLPKANHIKVSEGNTKVDPNHRWGAAPYHYIEGYYKEFIDKMLLIRSTKQHLINSASRVATKARKNSEVSLLLGLELMKQKKYKEAEREFNKLMVVNPQNIALKTTVKSIKILSKLDNGL